MNPQSTQYNPTPIIRALEFVKENILPFDDTKDGRRFLSEFEKFLRQQSDFKDSYPDIYHEIFEMTGKLKWLCLPNLEEKAIIDLIANHFTDIFSIPNFNLSEKFKTALTHLLDLAQRDELKAKIKTVILKNSQVITTAGMVIDTHEHRGTIANWLTDYNKNLGGTRPADTLKFREYLTRGQNTADLAEPDKTKLLVLFSFYESLKLSSQTPAGLEESIAFTDSQGHLKVLEQGLVEDVDTNKQVRELMKLANIEIESVGADLRVRPVRPIHPIGQTHRSAPTDTNMDNFTFQDARIVDQFRQPGAAFQPHQFAAKLQQVKNIIKPGFFETWFDKRLESVILTYLKGIRDEIDTRQRLADNVKIGGLGLGPEIINQIFAVLSSNNFKQAEKKSKIFEPPTINNRPAADLKNNNQTTGQAPIASHRTKLPTENKIVKTGPTVSRLSNNQSKIKKSNRPPQILAAKINTAVDKLKQNKEFSPGIQNNFLSRPSNQPRLNQTGSVGEPAATAPKQTKVKRVDFKQINQSRAAIVRFQPNIPSKHFMQDVKAPPSQDSKPAKVELSGPVQEIAGLNLADLRKTGRLNSFADFLLQKIKEIEKISYAKKAQAIKAWQSSPLYCLYLKLGSAGLQQDKSLQDIIKTLDPSSNLTWEEFEEISRLNGQMRN